MGPKAGVFPPCTIIDLDARIEDDKVILSWTASGNYFDEGQGMFLACYPASCTRSNCKMSTFSVSILSELPAFINRILLHLKAPVQVPAQFLS